MCAVIDFHTHILPCLDDGSSSAAMSAKMLTTLHEQGADTVCLTPHYYAGREEIPAFLERRDQALTELKAVLPSDSPRLMLGAEVAYFPAISQCRMLDALCFRQTDTLLLEMPYACWTQLQVQEVISLVLDRKVQVVLAHPERFLFDSANRKSLEKLLQLPVGLQVNAQTLIHWTTRRQGLNLLKKAKFPLLGTDCHDLDRRNPELEKARKVIRRRLGQAFLKRMDGTAEQFLDIRRNS